MKQFLMQHRQKIQWTIVVLNGLSALIFYSRGDLALAALWTVLTVSFLFDALDQPKG